MNFGGWSYVVLLIHALRCDINSIGGHVVRWKQGFILYQQAREQGLSNVSITRDVITVARIYGIPEHNYCYMSYIPTYMRTYTFTRFIFCN